jgi:hypothetical protein
MKAPILKIAMPKLKSIPVLHNVRVTGERGEFVVTQGIAILRNARSPLRPKAMVEDEKPI